MENFCVSEKILNTIVIIHKMDIISAWYLILILGLIMMKLFLFWGQGEESGLAKSDTETERRLSSLSNERNTGDFLGFRSTFSGYDW